MPIFEDFLSFGVGIFISFFIGFWLPFAELAIYMTWYMMMHRILGLLFFSKVDANRLCFQNLSLVFRITVFFGGKRYIFVGVRLRPFFLEFSLICSWYHGMFSYWAETSAPLKILPGYFGVSYSSFSWRGKQILAQGSRPVIMIVSALPAFLKSNVCYTASVLLNLEISAVIYFLKKKNSTILVVVDQLTLCLHHSCIRSWLIYPREKSLMVLDFVWHEVNDVVSPGQLDVQTGLL